MFRVNFSIFLLTSLCILHYRMAIAHQELTKDFKRHFLVKPRIYERREKRQISTTKQENSHHYDHLTIIVPIKDEELVLDLTLNKQLVPKGFFLKVQENRTQKTIYPGLKTINLCHYKGKVRNKTNSWVALSTCHGLSGVIYDGNEMYYVEKKDEFKGLDNEQVIYKESDLLEHNKKCGYADPDNNNKNTIYRHKRAVEENFFIRGPHNAGRKSKYVELVLVVDYLLYMEFSSFDKVQQYCKTIVNIVNGFYAPLDIFVTLVGVVIWNEGDKINILPNADNTLDNFLKYRREELITKHPNDNAQLISKVAFKNGVIGKAFKGAMCTYSYSGAIINVHSHVVGLVAATMAHEMGHNFGMDHDTDSCRCPDDQCIMGPASSSKVPTHWSSCSLTELLLAFTLGIDYCLRNQPKALFDSPTCGNGFVEAGEQCDCGLPENCDSVCCNPSTCTLHANATCATGKCCDLTTCKLKNAGTLCRSADYECDLPEYCTGQSEYCPTDTYKMDTEVCGDGQAFCYHGFCRTRTDQCKLLWGQTGKSNEGECYKTNVKGSAEGNCGYNILTKTFLKCENEDIFCGLLQCTHLSNRLEFGMNGYSSMSSTSYINMKKGPVVKCHTAIVDLGIDRINVGLVPNGAKCGEGKVGIYQIWDAILGNRALARFPKHSKPKKYSFLVEDAILGNRALARFPKHSKPKKYLQFQMCVNQKCVSIATLLENFRTCPNNCNNNGWCNNFGHCHCKDDFAPPFCDTPGLGGSEDSGPASDPNDRQKLIIALTVIFVLILFALLAYYFRSRIPNKIFWEIPKIRNTKNYLFATFERAFSRCEDGGTATRKNSASEYKRVRNVDITRTDLTSTTNIDIVVRSKSIMDGNNHKNIDNGIKNNKRLSLKNVRGIRSPSKIKVCPYSRNNKSSHSDDKVPSLVISVKDLAKKFESDKM